MSAVKRRVQRLGFVAAAAAALPQAGCSLIFTEGPPARVVPGAPISCSRSFSVPILDGALLGYQAFRTLNALGQDEKSYGGAAISKETDVVAGLILSTLAGISMGVGIDRVSRCNELLAQSGRRPAPPPPSEHDEAEAEAEAARARAAAVAKSAREAGEAARRASPTQGAQVQGGPQPQPPVPAVIPPGPGGATTP